MTVILHFGMRKSASTSPPRSFRAKGRWNGHAHVSTSRTQSNNIERFNPHSNIMAPVLEMNREDAVWTEDVMGASLAEEITAPDATAVLRRLHLHDHGTAALDFPRRRIGMDLASPEEPFPDPQAVATWLTRLRDNLDAAA